MAQFFTSQNILNLDDDFSLFFAYYILVVNRLCTVDCSSFADS